MAEIVPVDQFLDWYPGWTPELTDSPWVSERSGPFRKEDESRFWFVDFHWPRGFSPIGYLYVTDCASWGTQTAAHFLPLPPAKGLVQRMGGPFPYEGEVTTTSEWELGFRAQRIERNIPPFLQNFDAIWEARKWELELGLGYFESYDFAGKSLAEIGQFMVDARTFHKRAWEIHFELMYPLLGIYLQIYGLCASNGIDPGQVAKFFQGRDSRIMENDRAMWQLVGEAQRLGVADHFDDRARADPRPPRERGRQRVGVAHAVRRLPEGARLAHRGHRRHEHPVVDREPGLTARPDPQLPRDGRAARLREGGDRGACRARRGGRRRALAAERRDARRVQRAARDQPGRELRVVERRPQPLHRPAGVDPAAQRSAGARRSCRRRAVRRRAVPLLPGVHRRLRRPQAVEGPAVDRDRSPRVLRPLQRDPRHHPQGRRHAARQDRRSGPHRDLRDARPLLRADEERPILDSDVGLPGVGGHGQRARPG